MMKTKYIKTESNEIIMFGEIMLHSEFRHMNPVSAGFVSFGLNEDGNPTCSCYGGSITLGLSSDEEEDTRLAKQQFGLLHY